jgi:hypothetical protein
VAVGGAFWPKLGMGLSFENWFNQFPMSSIIKFLKSTIWPIVTSCFFVPMGACCQQLCQSSIDSSGVREICYHSDGAVSTVRFWDHEKRWGYFEAHNAHKEPLVKYDLRNFGGHASVRVSYHENGQVNKLEYTSAPDGGIQYWHVIHYFSAEGKEISKQDLSRPDGTTRISIPEEWKTEELTPTVVLPSLPSKDVLKPIEIMVMNLTGKPHQLSITKVREGTSRELSISAKDDMRCVDTLYLKAAEQSEQWIEFSLSPLRMKRYAIRKILDTEVSQLYVIVRREKYQVP